jgi:hypothetical protein
MANFSRVPTERDEKDHRLLIKSRLLSIAAAMYICVAPRRGVTHILAPSFLQSHPPIPSYDVLVLPRAP